ncbi:xanthine dehydrogenase molybdopterin binding subunit [Oceanospirillaceae bacterium]|nr:xanthine dehydrogenase molybdopterin binding subunit [Oceanospirillaceae bacterium]
MRKLPELNPKTVTLEPAEKSHLLGKATPHESAKLHLTGKALYIDDIAAPQGCLHAYVGMANVASGLLKSQDLTNVANALGVVDVITVKDIPGQTDIGPVFSGDALLVDERIDYFGQPLFAVAATTRDAARKAARLGQAEIESTNPILTLADAKLSNKQVRPSHSLIKGDSKEALKQSINTLNIDQKVGGQEHFYLEGQVSLAIPQDNGGVLVHCSSQHPSEVQKLVAQVLNLPMHKVVVDMRRMGGGFGGKETQAAQWACLAALLAVRNQKAVKLRLARSDDMALTGKRHPFVNQAQVGFDNTGRITALDAQLNGLCGCSPDLSDAIVDRAMFHTDNAYYIPAATITGHRWFQNTVSNTAFRGFGGPQGMMLAEQMLDDIARSLGKDPLLIRQINLYGEDERNTTPYHQTVTDVDLPRIIDELVESSDYWGRREAIRSHNQAAVKTGGRYIKGLALTPVKFGISFTAMFLNQAGALVHIYTDGTVQVSHGGTEMGQGLYTKIAQIVAAQLGLPLAHIEVTSTRTDKVPNTSPTAASSGTDLNGQAARNAALTIKQRLVDYLVETYQVDAQDIEFSQGNVSWPKHQISFAQLTQEAYLARISMSATGYYRTPKIHYDREQAKGRPFFYYSCGASVSEVEVDTYTGTYTVSQVDILHDVGESINPVIDLGQVEGGFIQGMGWLTTEELVWGQDGRLQTNAGASYKIPAVGDTPKQFNVALLQNSKNHEATIYHSKAVGEPPFMHGISVWSALRDAIWAFGGEKANPQLDAPATPERVLWALQEAKEQAEKTTRGAS